MAGNVWEWVADWYGDYDEDETNNPMGPRNGTLRIMRGGSWLSYWYTNNFRAANRYSDNPAYSYSDVGFRCARTPPGAL